MLNIQIYVLIIQRTACLSFQRPVLSKPGTPGIIEPANLRIFPALPKREAVIRPGNQA
jgi:hypothetical protein